MALLFSEQLCLLGTTCAKRGPVLGRQSRAGKFRQIVGSLPRVRRRMRGQVLRQLFVAAAEGLGEGRARARVAGG